MKQKKKIILLDVFAILFRAYYSIPDLKNDKGRPTGALFGLTNTILNLFNQFSPTHIFACLDLKYETHRQKENQEYKANRASPEPDIIEQIEQIETLFKALSIRTVKKKGFEADDIIGTLTEMLKDEYEIIIATADHDILQLLDKNVKVFMLKKGIRQTKLYTKEMFIEENNYKPEFVTDFKGLCGDASDNIKGIKGIGKKGATILIENFQTIENIFKELEGDKKRFTDKKITQRTIKLLEKGKEDAFSSKSLATIIKDIPLNAKLISISWRDSFSTIKMKEYLEQLNFFSLIDRFEKLMGEDLQKVEELSHTQEIELGTMLWLIDSDYTSANQEEIFSFCKTTNYEESKKELEKKINTSKELKKVWNLLEKPLLSIIPSIERKGVLLDISFLKKTKETYKEKIKKDEKDIYKLAGTEFNINSPKQLSKILTEKLNLKLQSKTKSGLKSTKEKVLLKIQDKHPIVKSVLLYRNNSKILNTYICPFLNMVDGDDRLHTTLLQNGTTTGRFSSVNPNLQNIPKNIGEGGGIRKSFISPTGYQLVSFDYNQIDITMAAFLSKDKKLCEIVNKGEDIHKQVASHIYKISKDKITEKMRNSAKAINFGMLYGLGIKSFVSQTKHSKEEAEHFFEQHRKTFPQLYKYLEQTKLFAKKNGYVETAFGRRRQIHGINSSLSFLYSRAERMAINAPIQGSSADVIKIAMVNIGKWLQNKKYIYMILQVHDELLFEIKEEYLEEYSQQIKILMCENILPKECCIKLFLSIEKGKNWGSMKKYNN